MILQNTWKIGHQKKQSLLFCSVKLLLLCLKTLRKLSNNGKNVLCSHILSICVGGVCVSIFLSSFIHCGKNTSNGMYTFNKFSSVQYLIVDYRYNVEQQISRAFLFAWLKLYASGLITSLTPHLLVPSNHQSVWFSEFDYFWYLI